MGTPAQFDHDVFRILLYRNDATELLLETASDGLHIPTVPISGHTRVAEEITAAIKRTWSFETVCLFTLSPDDPSHLPVRYQVVESCQPEAGLPAGMQWCPVVSLPVGAFEDPGELAAIENSLTTLDQYRRGELSGFFGRPGWLETAKEWVEAQALRFGLRLNGKLRQLNASPLFSLIRFETSGPALWFKAVGKPNLHEYSITLKLAMLLPTFVPYVIASQPNWNAWLSVEAEGNHLDGSSLFEDWQTTVSALVDLQIASLGNGLHLIEAGCKDIRVGSLLSLVEPFFDSMAELMKIQTKTTPIPLSRSEIAALAGEIRSTLEDLSDTDIPNVLGHLDFNPGNILVSQGRCVFLDWAEGSVGHPVFTFQYLLENLRRWRGTDSQEEKSLITLYANHWTTLASPSEIATAVALAPLLSAFAYAAAGRSWLNRKSIRPETAALLRSLARRMKYEAEALVERRPLCSR
jgi:hypothetical protein